MSSIGSPDITHPKKKQKNTRTIRTRVLSHPDIDYLRRYLPGYNPPVPISLVSKYNQRTH